jgi:hypothetical protein
VPRDRWGAVLDERTPRLGEEVYASELLRLDVAELAAHREAVAANAARCAGEGLTGGELAGALLVSALVDTCRRRVARDRAVTGKRVTCDGGGLIGGAIR